MRPPRLNWIKIDSNCFRVEVDGVRYELRFQQNGTALPWWVIFRDEKRINAFPMLFSAQDFVAAEVAKKDAA